MNAFKSSKKQLNIKSIIFYIVCAFFVIAVCVFSFYLNITDTVALEQEIRCGIDEHTHTDSCYSGDFLVCKKTAHSHDGNCYIVLLKENNINSILSLLSNNRNHSLEAVITDTMSSALTFNSNINSTNPSQSADTAIALNADTVAELNNTISDEEELPNIILNENINNIQTLSLEQNAAPNQQENGGVSTLSLGDNPVTSNYNANFYIYLDDQWTCIGSLPFTENKITSARSNATIPTANILNLVNDTLGTNYTYNSFDISVSTSQNSGYAISNNIGMASVTTTIAYRQSTSEVKKARYIRLIPEGGTATSTAFAFYTVTFEYPNGSTVSQVVRSGTTITLPTGNYEWQSETSSYNAGSAVTITKKTNFKGSTVGPVAFVNINYNVNFPTVSGVTVSTKPTIAGLSSATVTDGFNEGTPATIRNVSQQSVEGKVNNNSTGLSRVIQFKGWQVGNSDVILQPNTTLIWEELLQYASGGTINLTAVWDYAAVQTATFFIRFDSVAVDTNGNITGQDQNKYTKELFSAYVGGIDTSLSASQLHSKYHIADTTSDNSFGADQAIRALYGERTDGVWLSAFPLDDYIFESLVQYAETGYLSVDGIAVKAEDLNGREYAIRWYVFKAQDDAWHIDGKLVKKEGLIHVYKTFAGNKELITEAKTDFYIDATDVSAGTTTVLNLKNYKSYTAATDTYMWEITNVDYGELWEITEHPHLFADPNVEFGVYSEYTVMDAHGDQSITGSGTSLTVSGMTYALDEGTDEVLRAEFTNIYNKSDSIVIKKQDALTGVSIGGATFRLLQNGKPLAFNYNSQTDSYTYDPANGTHTILNGTENGYFEISIQDFSYDLGNITIQEITAPTGYSPIGNVEIGYTDDQKTVGIIGGNSQMIKYINGILIIGNSTDSTTVTAKKEWDCPQNEWQPVTIQLLANGKLVTTVNKDAVVTLKANRPEIDKTVLENDGVSYGKGTSTMIGDDVTFKIETLVPSHTLYSSYNYYVNDKLPAGLTLKNDTIKVYLNDTTLLADGTDYNLSVPGDNGASFKVDFSLRMLGTTQYEIGDKLTIVYDAHVTDKIVAQAPNANTAILTYSNDPTDDTSVGNTSSTANVYSYQFVFSKFAEDTSGVFKNVRLIGAEFQLYKVEGSTKTLVNFTPVTAKNDAGVDFTKYIVAEQAVSGTTTDTLKVHETGDETITLDHLNYGGHRGDVFIFGLSEGKYELVETKAPDGYILPDKAFEIEIVDAIGELGSVGTLSVTSSHDGVGSIVNTNGMGEQILTVWADITNAPGSALPETGGMGTTLFTVIGVILMAGALAFFTSRKRSRTAA